MTLLDCELPDCLRRTRPHQATGLGMVVLGISRGVCCRSCSQLRACRYVSELILTIPPLT